MKTPSVNNDSTHTKFIQLDTGKCSACWNCQSLCKNDVIGRINLPWHKHARFVKSADCTGCLKCVKACDYGALTKISDINSDYDSPGKKLKMGLLVNIGLLIFGLVMSFSGFVIQFRYHMGHNPVTDNSGLQVGYYNWTSIHKASIIIFSLLAAYHFIQHWKWYKTIIVKKLASGNKLQIVLTIVFILAAITGYIPWIINLTGGPETARKFLIEIHDKIAILLFVCLIMHLSRRPHRKGHEAGNFDYLTP
jgi:2-oxoglutarate ferredoxin oxidoreductase subunit delta